MNLQDHSAIFLVLLSLFLSTACTGHALAAPEQDPRGFLDTDTGLWLEDGDGDGYPDLTEQIAGTDLTAPSSFPGSDILELEKGIKEELEGVTAAVGFPAPACRAGFREVGLRLCITTTVQRATTYLVADALCRVRRARVATMEDLFYLYVTSYLAPSYNPNGRWLGNVVGDDRVLRGNRSITFNGDPDVFNFEGVANKNDRRGYWCAHDRE